MYFLELLKLSFLLLSTISINKEDWVNEIVTKLLEEKKYELKICKFENFYRISTIV